jgi:hypothetical protein
MITVCKAVLSGSALARIREQTEGLEPGWLRDLPVSEPPDVQDAVAVVRAILLDDPAP